MKTYTINFYNRFAGQDQSVQILARNEFKARHLFFIMYPRESYYHTMEEIQPHISGNVWTEEKIMKVYGGD